MRVAKEHAADGVRWRLAVAGVVGASILGLVAWVVFGVIGNSAGPESAVTLEEVADEPEAHRGRRVTVSGEVGGFVGGGSAFSLGEGLTNTVLVVPAKGGRVPPLGEEDLTRVTGVVHVPAEPTEIASRTDTAVDDDSLDQFDGEPVIVASAITRLEENRDLE